MDKLKWIEINDKNPPLSELIHLKYVPFERGDNKGWVSKGYFRQFKSGERYFSIKQNKERTVNFKDPTHWAEINKNEIDKI